MIPIAERDDAGLLRCLEGTEWKPPHESRTICQPPATGGHRDNTATARCSHQADRRADSCEFSSAPRCLQRSESERHQHQVVEGCGTEQRCSRRGRRSEAIPDGRGLVAALSLGADGILLGTRFLATVELPLHPNFKQAIVDSDGHDTQLSEIPDIAAGLVWPGAMTRSRRNRFIERWAGREWALRQCRADAIVRLRAAREAGDVDEGPLSMGQDAGLIHDIPQAADIVSRIALEAEEILTRKLPGLLAGAP